MIWRSHGGPVREGFGPRTSGGSLAECPGVAGRFGPREAAKRKVLPSGRAHMPRASKDRALPREPVSEDVRAAALSYAARGWSVLPVEARGKRPLVPWLEFQQRTATEREISSWFAKWPGANVGIVTGQVSGLLVVDVDPQHDGFQSLATLEREEGALPRTVEVQTGGGGRHLYFANPTVRLHNRAGIRPGIDLRCEGGYVVAPPSLHPSGARYRWLPGQGPQDIALAALPSWFLEAIRVFSQGGHSLKHWRRVVREGVPEGQRNSVLASFTGHLLWHGVDPEIAQDLLLAWNRERCRPPLDDEEVVRVVQSIARMHAARSAQDQET